MYSRRRFLAASLALAVTGPSLLGAGRKPVLALGLVADPQFADRDPGKTRFYRQTLGKLAEAVDQFNSLDLACCVSLGDLIDRQWESCDAVLKPLARSRHQFHHVLGNHDFEVADALKERVPKRLGLKRRYYARWEDGFCLVMLDTTDISLNAHPQDSKETQAAAAVWKRVEASGAVNAQRWNGAVGEGQLAWFEDTCRRAGKEGRRVVVFAHHPIYPPGNHCEWNSDALLKVVERNRNVAAWFNGHNHAGDFGVHAEVPFFTLQGMVETEKSNSFAVLHLHPDRLELVGHGREPSRELKFRQV
jgi:manganese-dependent ADP-ribose/CDP-alcohol diphosphatase